MIQIETIRLINPNLRLCYSEHGDPGLLMEGTDYWDSNRTAQIELYIDEQEGLSKTEAILSTIKAVLRKEVDREKAN